MANPIVALPSGLFVLSWAPLLAVLGCGGSDFESAPEPNLTAAIAAAQTAATSDPACTNADLGAFYWEIGDAIGPLASGTSGDGSVTASTQFAIASSSKFIFGAYALEKTLGSGGELTQGLSDGLRFTSGYTDLTEASCLTTATVGACFAKGNADNADPSPNPDTVGHFYYQSGHDQKLAAIDLGLSEYTGSDLSEDYQDTLGLSPELSFFALDPLIAGGMQGTATAYAEFLRKLMNQELELGKHLGEDAVCAQPAACPDEALSSPLEATGEPWSYSYNHWVESETGNGTVDAYSSPGLFGFYPWLTPDRQYYGILSRHDNTHSGAYLDSVQCGRQLRKAFLGAL